MRWLLLFFMIPGMVFGASPYAKESMVPVRSEIDRLLALNLPEASDCVFVRRAYLDLLGRLPAPEEAKAYAAAPDADALIDRLLADPGFADFRSLHWCDALRVKSEFPVNLWPNAVYGYHRRIHSFIATNERYDDFARALLLSQGSNFRQPEVNFYRSVAERSAEGIGKAVAQLFLGEATNFFGTTFGCVNFKDTQEWKEEIVFVRERPDPRISAVEALIADPKFARCAVNRVWARYFGSDAAPAVAEALAKGFVQSGYDCKALNRAILTSSAYRAAPFTPVYPVRRLPAEVLADVIGDLTGERISFSSLTPEPYTFLPADQRSILLADGSITHPFLTLFGRPARDTGLAEERHDAVTGKQRLFLFNSAALYNRMKKVAQRPEIKELPAPNRLEAFYWLFFSRPPTAGEAEAFRRFQATLPPKERWRITQETGWILLNSTEFIHQH